MGLNTKILVSSIPWQNFHNETTMIHISIWNSFLKPPASWSLALVVNGLVGVTEVVALEGELIPESQVMEERQFVVSDDSAFEGDTLLSGPLDNFTFFIASLIPTLSLGETEGFLDWDRFSVMTFVHSASNGSSEQAGKILPKSIVLEKGWERMEANFGMEDSSWRVHSTIWAFGRLENPEETGGGGTGRLNWWIPLEIGEFRVEPMMRFWFKANGLLTGGRGGGIDACKMFDVTVDKVVGEMTGATVAVGREFELQFELFPLKLFPIAVPKGVI